MWLFRFSFACGSAQIRKWNQLSTPSVQLCMGCVGTINWINAGMTLPKRAGTPTAMRPAVAKEKHPTAAPREKLLLPRESNPGQLTGRQYLPGQVGITKGSEVGTQVEPDWSEVVRRCLSGDSPAWTELVRAHHRRVYALCYRFTGSSTDAEDLTQDVFLKVYANLTSFDVSRGSLQVWITTLARNLLVDHFRRTRNLRITGSLDEGWEQSGDLRPLVAADRLEAKGPTQHDQATRRELEKMVQQALAQVSPELREAVILRDLQDMDYKEIAQVLGIPEGTVKSRISRGRAELARLLERNKREVM
jgi:RNA polymerase sigma-70 factor, ECF subfamily